MSVDDLVAEIGTIALRGKASGSGYIFYACDVRDQLNSWLREFVEPLKFACDRDWKDESPEQILTIAANALYWRNR